MTSIQVLRERFLQSSGFASDMLIGFSDGLVLPFALASALSVVLGQTSIILIACLTESLLIALALGIATYQTIVNQAEEDLDPQQWQSIRAKKGLASHRRLQSILTHLEMPRDILEKADAETLRYRLHWNKLLSEYDLGLPLPDFAKARKNGFQVAMTYFAAAIVCLLPYLFCAHPVTALHYTSLITLSLLFVFGYIKAIYTGQSGWKGALRSVITGFITALSVYLVAHLFTT